MSLNRKILLSIAFITLMIGASFLVEHAAKENGLQKGSIIPVIQDNQTLAYLDTATIKKLMQKERGQNTGLQGPSLAYVLASVGAGKFTDIELQSLQKGGTAYYIKRQELDNTYILSLTDHNTVNLLKTETPPVILAENVSVIIINTKE